MAIWWGSKSWNCQILPRWTISHLTMNKLFIGVLSNLLELWTEFLKSEGMRREIKKKRRNSKIIQYQRGKVYECIYCPQEPFLWGFVRQISDLLGELQMWYTRTASWKTSNFIFPSNSIFLLYILCLLL